MHSKVSGFETPSHPVSIFRFSLPWLYVYVWMHVLVVHGFTVPFHLQQPTMFRDWEEGEGEGFPRLCTRVHLYMRMYVCMYVHM